MKERIKPCLAITFFILSITILFMSPKAEAFSVITSRADMGGNDFIDWGSFGGESTTIPSGSSIWSNSGFIKATVSNYFGGFKRYDQSSLWGGNFAPGDHLLYTTGTSSWVFSIAFSTPVFGVGAQVQRNTIGDFNVLLDTIDSHGNSVGYGWLNGVSNDNADNSAIFLGLHNDIPNISKIYFEVDALCSDFAMNQLDFVTTVPLPSTVLLLGSGLLGLVGWRRFRKS